MGRLPESAVRRSISELGFRSNLTTRRCLSVVTSPLRAVGASESRWNAGSALCCIKDIRRKLNPYRAPPCRMNDIRAGNARHAGRLLSIPWTPLGAGK